MKAKIDIAKLEKISRALGDPYRVKMLDSIRHEPEGVTCYAMKERFDLAQSTVSHHLKQLVDADLLLYEKNGRCSRYWINKKTLSDFVNLLKKI
jgi:ArsR family transcriptional regulator, arsenate/arsenite/antimonite-responsive transcriptional repressor